MSAMVLLKHLILIGVRLLARSHSGGWVGGLQHGHSTQTVFLRTSPTCDFSPHPHKYWHTAGLCPDRVGKPEDYIFSH